MYIITYGIPIHSSHQSFIASGTSKHFSRKNVMKIIGKKTERFGGKAMQVEKFYRRKWCIIYNWKQGFRRIGLEDPVANDVDVTMHEIGLFD